MRRFPELPTRLMRCVLAATAATLCLCGWARAARTIHYDDFLKWDDKTKRRNVQRYVRRDKDGYFVVAVSAYQVRTKISPQYALQMAILMDEFYRKFTAIFKDQINQPGSPQLYVFPDMTTYRGYVASLGFDPGWSAGIYVPSKKILVGQRSQGEKTLKEILFHEGTHQLLHAYTYRPCSKCERAHDGTRQFLHAFTGQRPIPPWFNEGVATNFQTWDLTLGAQENVKTNILKSEWLPIAASAVRQQRHYDLRKLTDISNQAWSATADPQLNYAMAWSLVNYLLKNTSTRDIRLFNAILAAIRSGQDVYQAMTPLVRKKLEAGWHEDLKTRVLLYDAYIRPALAAPSIVPDHGNAKQRLRAVEAKITSSQRAAKFESWLDYASRLKVEGKLLVAAKAYDEAATYAPKADSTAGDNAKRCRHDHYKAWAETALRQDAPQQAVELFARALAYRDEAATRRDLAKAQEELVSKGIAKYPDLPDGRYYRGRLLMKSEKYARAVKDFAAIEKQGSDFPQFYKLLGTCYFKTGEMDQARRALYKARRKDRRDQEIKNMLAEISRAGRRR